MIEALLKSHRILVCCGSGGVGKTTTSAALALKAAELGLTSIVITIDPAKRLATSLGLEALSPNPTDLTETVNAALAEKGEAKLKGRFFAVMPDTGQTFEHFVRSMSRNNEKLASRVLQTSIYKVFAKDFSGTNEYMAMEKLFQIHSDERFDLIVLDTPPSANTKLFLEAPDLLSHFFDDKVIKWFVNPGSKLLASGLRKLLDLLERLTGKGFIADLLEFATALFELRGQFSENLSAVSKLLHQSSVRFLLVTSPERLSRSDTEEFVSILHERDYPFWGFILNRMLSKKFVLTQKAYEEALKSSPADEAGKILKETFAKLSKRFDAEFQAEGFLSRLPASSIGPGRPHVIAVSEQDDDVHSVAGLLKITEDFQ